MNIHLKIKEFVNKKGAEIIVSNTLIGMLDDELVFDDVEAVPYKKILRNIIKEGYAQKLLDLGSYTPDVKFLASQYAGKNLMQEPPVLYVLDCLAYGLGWINKEPVLQAITAPTQAPTANPQMATAQPESPKKKGLFDRVLDFFGLSSTSDGSSKQKTSAKKKSTNNIDMNASADECYSNGAALAHTKIREAVKWFERGAQLGHGGCENELAVYYFTKNQKKKALSYAKKAIDCGFLDSAFVLGMHYFERALKTENEDDFVSAFSHISAALNPPKNTPKDHLLTEGLIPQAKALLGFCYMGVPGVPENIGKAKTLLEEAIAGGSAEAKLWYDQFTQAGHFKNVPKTISIRASSAPHTAGSFTYVKSKK